MSIFSLESKCILVVLYTGNTKLYNSLEWEEDFLFLSMAVRREKGDFPCCGPEVIFLLQVSSS